MTISIQQGLNELKLLDKRIEKATEALQGSTMFTKSPNTKVKTTAKTSVTYTTEESVKEFINSENAKLQSVLDLISRRAKLKSAISRANAVTKVEISGKTMTIAEAIDRRNHLAFEYNLYKKLRDEFKRTLVSLETYNASVKKANELLLTEELKKADDSTDVASRVEKLSKVLADREAELAVAFTDSVEPVAVLDFIQGKIDELDQFDNDFSLALTVVNVSTQIDID